MSRTLTITLRGREVEIDYDLVGADPSVGILSEGFENETIVDAATGERLAWELTDAEAAEVCAVIANTISHDEGDDW